MSSKNKKKLFGKLKKPYRLLIVNENNFEERASFRLTTINVIFLLSVLFLVFFVISYFIMDRSKVGNYISTKSGSLSSDELVYIKNNLDKIERQNRIEMKRRADIIKVLKGEKSNLDTSNITVSQLPPIFSDDTSSGTALDQSSIDGTSVESDFAFESLLFFPPLKGKISQAYDVYNHKAVDITPVISDESVKSTLDGTVVFTGWTYEFGHVIQVQHASNLVSIYKHNAYLHKRIGDYVSAGEVIAIAGNSGELTSGTHLHFELWFNGRPLDPSNFISF